MGAALRFKNVKVPRKPGEQARLKVVQGPDAGAVYVITAARATLGRGEENDIMVSDLKASRRHAEFALEAGGWSVKDLGSVNGLMHNGKPTRGVRIATGDTLVFGETTLEFLAAEAGTLMLVAPPRDPQSLPEPLSVEAAAQLAADNALEEQRQRVRGLAVAQASLPNAGGAGAAKPGSRRLLLYGAAAAAVLLMFFNDDEPAQKSGEKKKDGKTAVDLSKFLPPGSNDPVTTKMVEQFFKAGFREYMAGNYIRAKTQFETVLQMSPGHPMATLYKKNCEIEMEAQIKSHLIGGKRGIASGRLKAARGHYESVMRALYYDQGNPAYIEARDQLEKVNKMADESGVR
jgi:pSer/pThr/pTyr-binding forkhead associated (FHA) protein